MSGDTFKPFKKYRYRLSVNGESHNTYNSNVADFMQRVPPPTLSRKFLVQNLGGGRLGYDINSSGSDMNPPDFGFYMSHNIWNNFSVTGSSIVAVGKDTQRNEEYQWGSSIAITINIENQFNLDFTWNPAHLNTRYDCISSDEIKAKFTELLNSRIDEYVNFEIVDPVIDTTFVNGVDADFTIVNITSDTFGFFSTNGTYYTPPCMTWSDDSARTIVKFQFYSNYEDESTLQFYQNTVPDNVRKVKAKFGNLFCYFISSSGNRWFECQDKNNDFLAMREYFLNNVGVDVRLQFEIVN